MRSGVRSPAAPQDAPQDVGLSRWERSNGPLHAERPRASGEHRVRPDLPRHHRRRRADHLALLRSVLLTSAQASPYPFQIAFITAIHVALARLLASRAAPFADDSGRMY